jgi:hypothetical protein
VEKDEQHNTPLFKSEKFKKTLDNAAQVRTIRCDRHFLLNLFFEKRAIINMRRFFSSAPPPSRPIDALIVGAARTPTGALLGSLASLKSTELGSHAISNALKRSGIPGAAVDEVFMGCVLQVGPFFFFPFFLLHSDKKKKKNRPVLDRPLRVKRLSAEALLFLLLARLYTRFVQVEQKRRFWVLRPFGLATTTWLLLEEWSL